MGRKTKLWGVGLLVAASVGVSAPASADEHCVGTNDTIVVCVDPTGGPMLIDDCAYVVDPTCKPVQVPGPVIWCNGRYHTVCKDL